MAFLLGGTQAHGLTRARGVTVKYLNGHVEHRLCACHQPPITAPVNRHGQARNDIYLEAPKITEHFRGRGLVSGIEFVKPTSICHLPSVLPAPVYYVPRHRAFFMNASRGERERKCREEVVYFVVYYHINKVRGLYQTRCQQVSGDTLVQISS